MTTLYNTTIANCIGGVSVNIDGITNHILEVAESACIDYNSMVAESVVGNNT